MKVPGQIRTRKRSNFSGIPTAVSKVSRNVFRLEDFCEQVSAHWVLSLLLWTAPLLCQIREASPRANREPRAANGKLPTLSMKLVIAGTGASGAIYLQRLLQQIDCLKNEVHLVLSPFGRQVVRDELKQLEIPDGVQEHNDKSMNVPFASGSALFDAMVIVPCTMGTLGRIAAGTSDSLIHRAADVFLKERRKLVLVPRETPWNLIHARNCVTLLEAGAVILPAAPSFYSQPNSIEQVVDTVVHRILDQVGLPIPGAYRWFENPQ
jgi:flavin prenyltransferase